MNVAVVTFPGSNCDYDIYKAAQQVGGSPTFVWHRERGLDGYDVVEVETGEFLKSGGSVFCLKQWLYGVS